MKPMNADEPGSTGALLTSVCHELSPGKSGSGPGRTPPCVGPIPAALAGDGDDRRSSSPLTRAASWPQPPPSGAAESLDSRDDGPGPPDRVSVQSGHIVTKEPTTPGALCGRPR